MNLFLIFTTGLLAGGLTCLAVQGGLLATMIAEDKEQFKNDKDHGTATPILVFIIAKLAAYTILGFLLGSLGSVLQLSLRASLIIQFAVIIFMLGNGLNLLNVHPIFRYFVLRPPKSLTRLLKKQTKKTGFFAPVLLGAFTIFIPCGTTQAMMGLAISSGNAFAGAGIMFAFILGTSPLFFILGYFASKLGDSFQRTFFKFAAVLIIALALYSLNGALALAGVSINFSGNSGGPVGTGTPILDNQPVIHITDSGYSPQSVNVKAGQIVTIKLVNDGAYTCAQALTIPSLGLRKTVPPGGTGEITFTPSSAGKIPFMCVMGMFRGNINVY